MQQEDVAQRIRLIGDEFDQLIRTRRAAAQPVHLPPFIHEAAALLGIGFLLFVIGRKILLGSADGKHHSQV